MTAYIGIDPGQTGGLALVQDAGDLKDVCPMPAIDSEVSGFLLGQIIETWQNSTKDRLIAVIEKVSSMPGQGVASTFKFGKNYGIAIGAVHAMGLPIHFVTPQQWKKTFSLINKDKDASRQKATELWPSQSTHWPRKKDNGMSDAALIAEHARREGL